MVKIYLANMIFILDLMQFIAGYVGFCFIINKTSQVLLEHELNFQ